MLLKPPRRRPPPICGPSCSNATRAPPTGWAACADNAVNGVKVFGGLVLNAAVGGVNPTAVTAACAMGAKQIWMPTISAVQHLRHFEGALDRAVPIFNGGKPVPHLDEVLELIAQADIILGTGHLSPAEIRCGLWV